MSGEHTIKLGIQYNNTVSCGFDNIMAYNENTITPNYFGDNYLAGRYNTTLFTNYQTGTAYEPVRKPATVALLGIG